MNLFYDAEMLNFVRKGFLCTVSGFGHYIYFFSIVKALIVFPKKNSNLSRKMCLSEGYIYAIFMHSNKKNLTLSLQKILPKKKSSIFIRYINISFLY